MRLVIAVLWMTLSMTPALGQVSVGISLPGVSIGINVPVHPELVRVPRYPVYYAPRLGINLFFYDGLYWVYQADDWREGRGTGPGTQEVGRCIGCTAPLVVAIRAPANAVVMRVQALP